MSIRNALRPLARRLRLAPASRRVVHVDASLVGPDTRPSSPPPPGATSAGGPASGFGGEAHVESAVCPRCGSIARDRFLFWCFIARDPAPAGARLLETSPRLGASYRQFMRTWFDYRASDFDLSAHAGDIRLDLQQIDLPTAAARRRADAACPGARAGHGTGARRAVPGDRARWTDVPAGAVAPRGHRGPARAGVPRRQHTGVLQLRLGSDRAGARCRVRGRRPRPERVPRLARRRGTRAGGRRRRLPDHVAGRARAPRRPHRGRRRQPVGAARASCRRTSS